jgi:hypothetical protein
MLWQRESQSGFSERQLLSHNLSILRVMPNFGSLSIHMPISVSGVNKLLEGVFKAALLDVSDSFSGSLLIDRHEMQNA